MEGLSKRFGGVAALDGVDLTVRPGEVHGLVGANGAGKSTLIRCLAGLQDPDEGTISVDGVPVHITSPNAATDLGLAFIHQELNLVPQFDAVRNMLLGRPKVTRFGLVDWKNSRRPAAEAAERIGIDFSLERPVSELSVAQRWSVSIGRALVGEARMIAMDEPTASLSGAETARLHAIVRDLAASGVSVLYVSHRLDEVLDLCDTVSVFRDGRLTRVVTRGELSKAGLVHEIVGRELTPTEPTTAPTPSRPDDAPVLDVVGLTGGPVRDATFELRQGEVLGLGGLVGAGRTELARMLCGADPVASGTVRLDGVEVRFSDVGDAVRHGVALVPEERRSQGLVLQQSVAFNINVADQKPLRLVPWLPFIRPSRARARARELVERLDIKTGSVDQPVGTLSGGNQQKVLIARWLTRSQRVLILDELSRGVDIGARGEIHAIIRDLARQGTGVLAISSDNEELVALCDRVVVMSRGRVVGELAGDDLTEDRLTELSYTTPQTDQEVA
ncbi:sugar ABC transporter ATP-binding protein [Phycicoccus duodecadis]|uniref:sugar ABC transporter ATP-binding protein n=1 Tax=Phycicoccus duodecadis TaxID=173053 RepID=UPI001B80A944|nr:sugar ABC transporter ATP-binding protein [Phycicoccus duodecadis]